MLILTIDSNELIVLIVNGMKIGEIHNGSKKQIQLKFNLDKEIKIIREKVSGSSNSENKNGT